MIALVVWMVVYATYFSWYSRDISNVVDSLRP